MSLRPLDEVRRSLSGAWDLTRAGFWWRTAESAADSGDWATATNRLLHLADPLDGVETGAPAWNQLAIAALDCALRAADPDLVTAVCAQLLSKAWPATSRLDMLTDLFALAVELDAVVAGLTLARITRQRYASSPWAFYAAAHFAELAERRGLRSDSPARIIANYERAAELFASAHQAEEAGHAQLCAAVARLVSGASPDDARTELRNLDVPPDDEFWLAFGRLHSPFWLDRVRAADWVVDVFSDDRTTERQRRNARGVARELMRRLPVRMEDAELDRIRAVTEDLDDELRWGIEAQLRGRVAAQRLADSTLSDLGRGDAKALQEEALPLDGFDALVDAWQGRAPTTQPRSAVVRSVVDVLLAEGDGVGDALRDLAAAVRDARDPRTLRPVVLALLRASTLDDDLLAAPIVELSLHYAQRAPTPTCGFLAVAKTLFDAGHHRAGAALTHRAIEDGERQDGYDVCIARAVTWAVREASDREMLSWLELGERELG